MVYGRGCVAIGDINNWEGVYNASNSQPSGLGIDVWKAITDKYGGDLHKFAKDLEKTNRWESFAGKAERKDDAYKPDRITSKKPDPLNIEWVYVIDPDCGTLSILMFSRDNMFTPGGAIGKGKRDDDGFWNYGHCRYRHKLVIILDTAGQEPDWIALDKMLF